jgi:hypothetical protein
MGTSFDGAASKGFETRKEGGRGATSARGTRLRSAPACRIAGRDYARTTPIRVVRGRFGHPHTDAGQEPAAEIPLSFERRPAATMAFTIRLDPAACQDPVGCAVPSVDRTVAVHHLPSMERIVADRVAPRLPNMIVLVLFTILALRPAAAGVYGAPANSVERRGREIGIRVELRTGRAGVVRPVARETLEPADIGTVAGLARPASRRPARESAWTPRRAWSPPLDLPVRFRRGAPHAARNGGLSA